MPEISLLPAATKSRSMTASDQTLVNLYPEVGPQDRVTLYGTPGLSLLCTLPFAPIRGAHAVGETAYFAARDRIYRVTPAGGYTLIGRIHTTSGRVGFADNGTQLIIMDGTADAFIVDIGAGVMTQITDTDLVACADPVFSDGFFLFREVNSGRVWKTSAYDGSSIDGLDFATAEAMPDNAVGLCTDHGEIWVAGTQTIEAWQNTGSSDYPYSRIPGAIIETGCASGATMLNVDNTIFWLGQDTNGGGVVWRANGYTPQRISTHEVELILSGVSTLADCYAWTYQQDGHLFYVLTVPEAEKTLVYDVSTQFWHVRGYLMPLTGEVRRHRACCHVYIGGKHLVGDYETGNIYELSDTTYSDNGDAIQRELTSQTIDSDGKRIFFNSLQLRMDAGVGLISGQGSNPQAMLATSPDGGSTWGNERAITFGAMGMYQTRVIWKALGSGFRKTFRVRITDPVPVAITGAWVEFE